VHQPRQSKSKCGHCRENQTPANRAANGPAVSLGFARHASDIQVHDFKRVVLDEFAARFHVFAHQRGENIFGGHGIL